MAHVRALGVENHLIHQGPGSQVLPQVRHKLLSRKQGELGWSGSHGMTSGMQGLTRPLQDGRRR